MLLAVNMENTYFTFGVFDHETLLFTSQISATESRSADEYAVILSGLLRMHDLSPSAVTEAILASVVRPLTERFAEAIRMLTGIHPLSVGPGVRTGLNIKTDFPTQIGADIVANAVAAVKICAQPTVVIDLGTATTIVALNAKGELSGVLILPGAATSLDALSSNAAELPRISIESPKALLGRNTVDSMTAGIVYGHAAMIDGLLDRIEEEWSSLDLHIIATGDLAKRILPFTKRKDAILLEPNLTLIGLKRIGDLNPRPLPTV